jgi:hypothetical protein
MMRNENNETNCSSDDNNEKKNEDGGKNKCENNGYEGKGEGKARIMRMKNEEWYVVSLS